MRRQTAPSRTPDGKDRERDDGRDWPSPAPAQGSSPWRQGAVAEAITGVSLPRLRQLFQALRRDKTEEADQLCWCYQTTFLQTLQISPAPNKRTISIVFVDRIELAKSGLLTIRAPH
ncbi:hypothetical protein SKAU_G00257900 [Synaphobranchus kaupii]|uniref:Uncharacterized protein n=1 Tax=Synaphobranchus kaupii TaxID=118154 RepID=A0A9Q1ISI5_SYNKA|nr:hypothetical protein SKAU_G00257900 [Synaphobranchus kaupii]